MSGGMTNFLQNPNAIDLSGFFPAYEVLTQQISMVSNSPSQFNLTLTLNRNKNGITNYIVLAQPVIVSTSTGISTLSNLIFPVGIFNKTNTNFSATILIQTTSPALSVTANIMFLIIYPYTPIQPIVNTLNYVDNAGNPISFFPQYMTSSISIPSSSTTISLSISLSGKSTSRTDYTYFGSFYDNTSSSGINATRMQQIYYYNVGQTNTSTAIRIFNNNLHPNVNVETLILYPITISGNNYTSNYNVIIGNTTYNLSALFPLCEFFEEVIANDDSPYDKIWTLLKNNTGTTQYIVLTSFVYSSAGTSGTYNPWEAISGCGNIIVTTTSTTFRTVFTKGTGQNWNGGIRCLVIYY